MVYRALGDHCYPTDIYQEHGEVLILLGIWRGASFA
jgi:hypothetical protein